MEDQCASLLLTNQHPVSRKKNQCVIIFRQIKLSFLEKYLKLRFWKIQLYVEILTKSQFSVKSKFAKLFLDINENSRLIEMFEYEFKITFKPSMNSILRSNRI